MGYRFKMRREVTCCHSECYTQTWIPVVSEFNGDGRLVQTGADWDKDLPEGWIESYRGFECPAHRKDTP